MARLPWLKLHTEIRTDPKMQALSDLEFRTWINILCLSAESKVRGVICIDVGLAYPVEGIARALFISIEDFTSCINKFEKLRMIDVDQDGIITVTHFDDRQYEKPSDKPEEVAKRVSKCRSKKSNADVTPVKHKGNAIEEDKEKEGDTDTELDINNNNNAREEIVITVNDTEETVPEIPQTANETPHTANESSKAVSMDVGTQAINWAEKNWGRMISPGEAEDIIAWCDEFLSRGSPDPDGVVIEALNECDAAGPDARNKRYLGGILAKWREAGVLTVDHAKARNAEHKSKSQKEHKRNKDPGDMPKNLVPKSGQNYEDFYL
ncbi:MAG: hypothetical protein APF81_08415 [Desulfosporosinus sp. BRH_c37]|nr:MAG: hypothetical protein APF81_08415 [Desulfosporosinus sp. BRH_c37]